MPAVRTKPAPVADKAALARLGSKVRARLASDPAVYHVPCEQAEIFAAADFLSPTECTRIIGMIDEVARPSPVYGGPDAATYRTSYSGDVDPSDSFVRMIERRICDLMGIEQSWSEVFQGQRYEPGQEFRGHFDWYDTTADYWPGETKRGGQRSWTAMVWLKFTRLGLGFPPQTGSLLMWNNALPDGRPNVDVMHAGMPVVRGVKYVITKWFRTRPWS
jgi:prolyl 4-hydroxylase